MAEEIEEVEEDRTDSRGRSRRRSRDEEDYDDRPSRRSDAARRHSRDEDDYDDDRRRRRYEDEPPRRRQRDVDEENRPRRGRRKRQGGIPVGVWIVTGSVVVIGTVVVVLVLVLSGGGGGGGPSFDNYSKVQKGMTEQQVIDLLGTPDPTFNSINREDRTTHSKALSWISGQKSIAVTFQDGKVLFKQRGTRFSIPGGGWGYQYGPEE